MTWGFRRCRPELRIDERLTKRFLVVLSPSLGTTAKAPAYLWAGDSRQGTAPRLFFGRQLSHDPLATRVGGSFVGAVGMADYGVEA